MGKNFKSLSDPLKCEYRISTWVKLNHLLTYASLEIRKQESSSIKYNARDKWLNIFFTAANITKASNLETIQFTSIISGDFNA